MGLLADARSIARRDPAAKGLLQVIFLYPGFHALANHRIAHLFYRSKLFFAARMISQLSRFFTGIEIHPGAVIGKGLFIDHGAGVVIGETAIVGDNCTIYHGVTLGGTGKEKGVRRHPILGNDVLVGTGAKILGAIKIGDNSLIGANAVLLMDVPEDSTVVGVPGRLIRVQGTRVDHALELDHASTPDLVEQEICQVLRRVHRLEEELRVLCSQAGITIERIPDSNSREKPEC
jgi:serine O-acetyltransferase